ncbi:MAG: UDP-N-acetylmuramoyl-L-alanyl-D-glutamate--2,6-diaminopimelate ligase [Haliscomenobacteraceae bacterium CHB4]|nr:UDP-N-acetylmuramoyl-L-alanyl-D-glutamate--2,6-diaminopimelate ligase [Haliscomenobacteraceae bacterium CHB4]
MTLNHLLQNVRILDTRGNLTTEVGPIRFDSRQVQPGDVFVAVRGVQVDGHQFIDKAIERGAAALVISDFGFRISDLSNAGSEITVVCVEDSAETLGQMASNYFNDPSHDLQLIGVTGTNGKTTTVTLLWQLFTRLGYKCGLIGTVENRVGEDVVPSTHTTPDAVQLHGLLRQMADAGCTHVFMEVSSHAVHQRRIAGATFVGGVFTNLTHDHLDYHRTFAEYRDAKKKFFDDLPKMAFALTNADDKNGAVMLQNTKAAKYTYGLRTVADFKAKIIDNSLTGLHLELDGAELFARMIGEFNAYNLTAAYAVATLMAKFTKPQRFSKLDILTALSDLHGAEGRFDYINHPSQPGCIGIVDYAHTPDALEKVLETIQKLKKKTSRVITVTGAGGDRDKTKRPLMAQLSARMSDQLILTSDNPRTEDPASILRDMEAGLDAEGLKKTLVIQDREQAIKTAVRLAGPNDIILVAGKGHEKYQDVNGVKYPFDDKQVLLKAMS